MKGYNVKVTIDIDETVPLTKSKLRKYSPDAIINIFGEEFSNRLFKYSRFVYKEGTVVGKYWYFDSAEVYDAEEEKKIIFPLVKSIKVNVYDKELRTNTKSVCVDIDPHRTFKTISTRYKTSIPTTYINFLSIDKGINLIDEHVVTFDKPKSFKEISKEKISIDIFSKNIEESLLSLDNNFYHYVYLEIHYEDNSRSNLLFNKSIYVNQTPIPKTYLG